MYNVFRPCSPGDSQVMASYSELEPMILSLNPKPEILTSALGFGLGFQAFNCGNEAKKGLSDPRKPAYHECESLAIWGDLVTIWDDDTSISRNAKRVTTEGSFANSDVTDTPPPPSGLQMLLRKLI